MYQKCKLMFMVCESPMHAGSGSDLDFIDKPIQRERHTGYPKIESSSLKGALRERFSEGFGRNDSNISAVFGPEDPVSGQERQGSIAFSDARVMLFPVKSMRGVFAWVTCQAVLERFVKDSNFADGMLDWKMGTVPIPSGEALVFSDDLIIKKGEKNYLVLEEFALEARKDFDIVIKKPEKVNLQDWLAENIFSGKQFEYWKDALSKKLVILSDDDFADFVELTTEVITRNKIDPATGTVKNGHLFTEEYLPADTILYSLVMSHAEFQKAGGGKSADEVMKYFSDNISGKFNNVFQAGGNATIGKGLLRTILI